MNYDFTIKIVYEGLGAISIYFYENNDGKNNKLLGSLNTNTFVSKVIDDNNTTMHALKICDTIIEELNLRNAVKFFIPKNANLEFITNIQLENFHTFLFKARVANLINNLIIKISTEMLNNQDTEYVMVGDKYAAMKIYDIISDLHMLSSLKANVLPTYIHETETHTDEYIFNCDIDSFGNAIINLYTVHEDTEDSDNIIVNTETGKLILIKYDNLGNTKNDRFTDLKYCNIFQIGIDMFSSVDDLYNVLNAIVDKGKENMMIAVSNTVSGRTSEYTKYIHDHVSKVIKGFTKYGTELCKVIGADYSTVKEIINSHDSSKFSTEEFDAYRHKFYPTEDEKLDEINIEIDFKKAWLHHIHCNPHHPEYWVLTGTENGIDEVLDMPPEYIVEMILDWDTFKKPDGTGGAYDYYFKAGHRKEGLLTDHTRMLVEKGLQVVK